MQWTFLLLAVHLKCLRSCLSLISTNLDRFTVFRETHLMKVKHHKFMLCFLYRTVKSRPASNPYCQAGVLPFCPTGRTPNAMPTFNKNDTLYVYAMKAPVWEFKFGSLLEKYVSVYCGHGLHTIKGLCGHPMSCVEVMMHDQHLICKNES